MAIATLAAGLLGAVYLVAQVTTPVRPRASVCRVVFTAPAPETAPVAFYEAEVKDVSRDSLFVHTDLEYTVTPGPVDTHIVYVDLEYRHLYRVRVRGHGENGLAGPWSEWSEIYEHESLYETPAPPGDG